MGKVTKPTTNIDHETWRDAYRAGWEQRDTELRAEIERLTLADRQWADHVKRLSEENERLRAHIEKGHSLVNDMDLRMPEQATEDADGWINSYRIPVGPWHRLLGWARGGW